MTENGLISIIVPCYNVSRTLTRYLESIINQTYKKIEIIAVNDGSTDTTSVILNSYINKCKEKGIILKYIYQENAGLGAAINKGLKYVEGDYLCWSDPDDFYFPTAMEKRLNAFKKHPDCAVVSCDAYVFNSNDLNNPIKREAERFENRFKPNQFEYLLTEDSHFCAGCHMVRMSDFIKVNPNREIYPARRGQNWQLLLPVYYKFKRYYLDEPLYAYIIYKDSMSKGDCTEKKELDRWQEHETIIRQTLKTIPLKKEEVDKYDKMISVRYAKKRFYTAIDYKDKSKIKEEYLLMKKFDVVSDRIKTLYLRNSFILLKLLYKIKEL